MFKKFLALAACVGFLLLAGCNRCDMWDWYCPCDLIEGRADRNCGPCQYPCYQAGQVVRSEIAVPAEPAAASDVTEPLPPPVVQEAP